MKNGYKGLKLVSKMALKKWNVYTNFGLDHSVRKKQDYLFRCPVAPAEIFCWNDLKSRVPFTSQTDFPEFFCKWQTCLVRTRPFNILVPFTRDLNLHRLALKFRTEVVQYF